jgi:hypothetical protein
MMSNKIQPCCLDIGVTVIVNALKIVLFSIGQDLTRSRDGKPRQFLVHNTCLSQEIQKG